MSSTSTDVGQKGIVMKGSRGYVRDVKDRFGESPDVQSRFNRLMIRPTARDRAGRK
jgi:hypothetical protein